MNQLKTYFNLKDKKRTNHPNKVVVHHTGGINNNPSADTSHHTAKMVENYHLSLGWEGIGYHWFIERDGTEWQGRPEHRHGAHTIGQNKKSIGICLAGNFDVTKPTEAQEMALTARLNKIVAKTGIKTIEPHRKYAKKTCYGSKLSDTWASDLIINPLAEYTIKELIDEILRRIRR